MILKKELTIQEATRVKNKLENELELYLHLKEINYIKTQPSSVKIKDIVTSRTNNIFDKFSQYVIKDEEYDDKIYSLMESINAYEKYIIEEMKRLSKLEPQKLEIYLSREDLDFIAKHSRKRTWKEIGELYNYSERQVQRIYNEIVNGKL